MSKRFLIISIMDDAMIAVVMTVYYGYRSNAARVDIFRRWMRTPLHTRIKNCLSGPDAHLPCFFSSATAWSDSSGVINGSV
jgi:hypothetical protein